MKLGARILKTGMAVVLALFVAEVFQLPSPVFAGIAAVFAIQPSIYRSYLTIIEQVQGNIIGAMIAVLFVLLFGNHYIFIGLAAIIVIIINLQLKIENTISLSLVTLIVIMVAPDENFISFAVIRFLTIFLGIFSAFLINLIFLPPKYETKLFSSISDITGDILKWIRLSNRQAAEHLLLKKDISSLKDKLIHLDQIYLFFKEERTVLRKNRYQKQRKLVIYRQMITLTRKSLDLLKKIHHYENDLQDLPEMTWKQIQEKLDNLTSNHEHILMRYSGKARQIHEEKMSEYEANFEELLVMFTHFQTLEMDKMAITHMLQIISMMMDYNEQLEHLEILLNSYQAFHKNEMEMVE
ncbi:FUSC family protein [Bacillus kwashiorkori]|uniref:FUSC family protein n=1 Tax=Bacillus kwashiorkori TaxID=1522318 RepID=UPI00078344DD|nr:aromatic acid exporter family protein [Bacillus kwashiorkori]